MPNLLLVDIVAKPPKYYPIHSIRPLTLPFPCFNPARRRDLSLGLGGGALNPTLTGVYATGLPKPDLILYERYFHAEQNGGYVASQAFLYVEIFQDQILPSYGF